MTTELIDYDSADHFTDADGQAALIEDAFASGEAAYIAHAMGIVARAHGMTKLAEETGIKRQALYRALCRTGNPTLVTFVECAKALDLVVRVEPRASKAA